MTKFQKAEISGDALVWVAVLVFPLLGLQAHPVHRCADT
jgi:hypothetical protein